MGRHTADFLKPVPLLPPSTPGTGATCVIHSSCMWPVPTAPEGMVTGLHSHSEASTLMLSALHGRKPRQGCREETEQLHGWTSGKQSSPRKKNRAYPGRKTELALLPFCQEEQEAGQAGGFYKFSATFGLSHIRILSSLEVET